MPRPPARASPPRACSHLRRACAADRGAHFALVFFDSHAAVWFDGARRLARASVVAQLAGRMPPHASLETFASPRSPDYLAFRADFQPCLALVSDARAVGDAPPGKAPAACPVRQFALDTLAAGTHLLLLSDLEVLSAPVSPPGFSPPRRSHAVTRRAGSGADSGARGQRLLRFCRPLPRRAGPRGTAVHRRSCPAAARRGRCGRVSGAACGRGRCWKGLRLAPAGHRVGVRAAARARQQRKRG
jgi:hypothetical protein